MKPLMQQAAEGEAFQRPDLSQIVPDGMEDVVARVSAAGQKLMYSPDMRDELQAAVQSEDPIPKKLAENVTGLMLTLDSQTKGGIPEEAIFPAAVDLLAEAAEALTQAGQTVTQEDFREAMRMMYVLIGKKLQIPDEQLVAGAEKAAGGGGEVGEEAEPPHAGEPPEDSPADEEEDMKEGFA